MKKKDNNLKEDEINKENTPQVKRKCANAEKDVNVLNLKPIQIKKSKVDETKELENVFSSVSQKIMNILQSNENKEDEAFAHFITAHLANLSQSEKNIKKKMITDVLFSLL